MACHCEVVVVGEPLHKRKQSQRAAKTMRYEYDSLACASREYVYAALWTAMEIS